MQHSHPTLAFKPFILFLPALYLLALHPHHLLVFLAVSFYLLLPLPLTNSLRVLQWNAGGLQARSTELLHFISSHPVDLIRIQEPHLNSSSSFQITGFSKPGALNCYTLFRLIPLTLFVSRNLTLIHLPLSRSLDSLLCYPMALTPDLVFFSTNVTDASRGVIIFVT